MNRDKANRMLQETTKVLEDMGAGYWVDSGTLLSAYRDKDINAYDHDIDVRVLPGEVPEDRMGELVGKLWDVGYRQISPNHGKRAELICVGDDIMLDLKFAFKDQRYLWVYLWFNHHTGDPPRVHCYPLRFFDVMGEIELLGKVYPCPTPVEEYIVHHYGTGWRKFKTRATDKDMTDLTWSHMYSPPCAMSTEELIKLRQEV